ncbi:MAG TPA: hypothetical protein VFX69_11260 [Steroidobacteraceae bacterium]|nr:hypothetical protein [Steroidobacteraceae bacterium]
MRWGLAILALVVTAWGAGVVEARAETTTTAPAPTAATNVADGRAPLAQIMARFHELDSKHGWNVETLYAYPDAPEMQIKAWHVGTPGPALWVLSGIHGEEPAGPNAIARELDSLVEFARSGVPVVVIPLCNPKAYRQNWRYPNTAERDWRKGGYSVGDAEYLLPDLESGRKPRAAQASGPETLALTQYVLRLAGRYPPRLVLDLHEDELSTEGGYIYSQGRHADANPAGAEIVRLLQASGIPLRRSGQTRFGETIVDGVISRDDKGGPIRDGSIDELLAATEVFVEGRKQRGPSAQTVIVVETPAFAGARLDQRVDAQAAVVRSVATLWRVNAALP